MSARQGRDTNLRQTLNKVPEVTIFFWIIKVLCTTVGETASDFLNVSLGFGLTGTSVATGIALALVLVRQFKTNRYVPVVYWLGVVLISIFGTLVTDNLTDALGFPLEYSTILFSALLLITFVIWYRQERTLSIHSIVTAKREGFYWLAVLFTFALGTAAGDLMAEALGLGYATTGVIIVIVVVLFAAAWRLGLNSILAFWVVYILTRPLGASLGDLLSQSKEHGGVGVGPTATTALFAVSIALTVLYLTFTKRDVTTEADIREKEVEEARHPHVLAQVVVVAILFAAASVGGYHWRQGQLGASLRVASGPVTLAPPTSSSPLGDLSTFTTITRAMLDSMKAGDWPGASRHADDIEYAWDKAEARLRPMNRAKWTEIDRAIDNVLHEVRAVHPNVQRAKPALEALLALLNNP